MAHLLMDPTTTLGAAVNRVTARNAAVKVGFIASKHYAVSPDGTDHVRITPHYASRTRRAFARLASVEAAARQPNPQPLVASVPPQGFHSYRIAW